MIPKGDISPRIHGKHCLILMGIIFQKLWECFLREKPILRQVIGCTKSSGNDSHTTQAMIPMNSGKGFLPVENGNHCRKQFPQRSVWPVPQFITFNIVSRCFEKKNNNCCETKLFKNAICLLLFTNLQIHFWKLSSLVARLRI